ncbi:MAG: hypothetical protein K2G13_01770, partial [Muribaculaceae bacterium]|nr:hypothetical protein [Muribaculaceae bacterium]
LLFNWLSVLSNDKELIIEDLIITPSLSLFSSGTIIKPITISVLPTLNGKLCRTLPIIYNQFPNAYLYKEKDQSQIVELEAVIDGSGRTCQLYPTSSIEGEGWRLMIPKNFLEFQPQYDDSWGIHHYSDEELRGLSVTGAWKRNGTFWDHKGLFSIIDDDTIDGQIYSSADGACSYGYYSLLYPLLESLGLRGNLAMEGRRAGLSLDPPDLNENGKIAKKLQDVKGWEVMAHSMECLGERQNNWIVDSLNSPLAQRILIENEPAATPAASVSIYDLQTCKQYHVESKGWVESASRWIKPYAGHYDTKTLAMFNPDYDAQWAWGELVERARNFGIEMKSFVTHNSTSSHALVREIQTYLKYGFSDLATPYYNIPPMLSTATRFAVEGTTLPGYKGESDPDNTFNKEHFKIFTSRIDEAAELGGWVAFNLHTYRKCWKNSLSGMLKSEGGSYPDEWVIPILETDELDDNLNPPKRLGINNWKDWYPCPGTKLDMFYRLLKYALDHGMINVTASEGFELMGNPIQEGYYSAGIKIGSDAYGLQSTSLNYPHYIKGANGAVDYYNP